ncbi:MAG: MoxR family ATPase [Fimbriimonadales bacterium]|nr:MoxR family ATPase [Fimbriimonadales bacterium]GBC90729.1 ATPase RavA [bacterium HR14]
MTVDSQEWLTESEAREVAHQARTLIQAVERVILGKTEAVRLMITGLLSGGHLLIEDIPGVGKTTLARALARAIGGQFRRIQFTPDLLPADVTGSVIYNQRTGQFEFHPGPIFANIVLADEINRATPKTQSALLEAMEERTVSVEGASHPLPHPFLVIATQNNIEMVGTYPLPEAQMDRFFARVSLGYPSPEVEEQILASRQLRSPLDTLEPVLSLEQLEQLQQQVRRVYISPAVRRYLVAVVNATRHHPQIALGASPRASLALMLAAQANAILSERHFVTPDDVQRMAVPVLAHRLILRSDSQGKIPRAEQVIQEILKQVPVPMGEET